MHGLFSVTDGSGRYFVGMVKDDGGLLVVVASGIILLHARAYGWAYAWQMNACRDAGRHVYTAPVYNRDSSSQHDSHPSTRDISQWVS